MFLQSHVSWSSGMGGVENAGVWKLLNGDKDSLNATIG